MAGTAVPVYYGQFIEVGIGRTIGQEKIFVLPGRGIRRTEIADATIDLGPSRAKRMRCGHLDFRHLSGVSRGHRHL